MDIDNSEEQFFLDINWYFTDPYNRLCIVASGGGILPSFLYEENNQNDEFHNIVNELPERFENGRNTNLIQTIVDFDPENLNQYFRDFDSLAKKGFYVYDKINLSNPEETNYLLVTYPIYNTETDSFPVKPEDLELIPRINISLISRTNESFDNTNFNSINLVSLLNSQKK